MPRLLASIRDEPQTRRTPSPSRSSRVSEMIQDKPKRGRPRIPAEQQRARLLDAAEQVLELNHFERTSVQDIVRSAGMSSRSFYECFASKDDLAIALAIDRGDAFLLTLEEVVGRASASNLEATVNETLGVFLRDLPAVLVDLLSPQNNTGMKVLELRERYRERITQTLLLGMIRMAQEGELPAPPNPMSLGLVLAGIESITLRYLAERKRAELLELQPLLLAAIRDLFSAQFR
jgi:AcrR family transcriptional regulator